MCELKIHMEGFCPFSKGVDLHQAKWNDMDVLPPCTFELIYKYKV